MPRQSDQIQDLAAALSKAQGQMEAATRNAENPHRQSRYADLESVWAVCRAPLTTNGLAVAQLPGRAEDGSQQLVTRLLHSSGQWIESEFPLPKMNEGRNGPQDFGSAITYARRYALMAITGVTPGADEDDDGEKAQAQHKAEANGQSKGHAETRRAENGQAPRNGQAQTSRNGGNKAQSQPQSQRQAWSQYIASYCLDTNTSWWKELAKEGVAEEKRKDLVNVFQMTNHLGTLLLELGEVSKAEVAKNDNPEVRDPAKMKKAVEESFVKWPEWTATELDKHVIELWGKACERLGIFDRYESQRDAAPNPQPSQN